MWRHAMYCTKYLRFETNMFKNQRNCNKQKIQCFWRWIWNLYHSWNRIVFIFSLVLRTRENKISCLTREINSIIQRQTIEYTLYNWTYFSIVLDFVTQMSEITRCVSMRHHSNNIHLFFLYMNWYQNVLDEVTETCM